MGDRGTVHSYILFCSAWGIDLRIGIDLEMINIFMAMMDKKIENSFYYDVSVNKKGVRVVQQMQEDEGRFWFSSKVQVQ